MKKFNGLKKISVKLNSSDAGVYLAIAATIDGSKKIIIEPGLTACYLPDGTILEFYGEGADYPGYLFSASDIVISFKVENLDETLRSMETAGAKLISRIEQVCSSYRFCHIQVNGEHILGIFEESE
jgi:hypothetical protein